MARRARLSEREKKILDLRYQGATAVEIADQLNMTPGGVRVTLHRIRKRLKVFN